jgi:general secretion pathway protein I
MTHRSGGFTLLEMLAALALLAVLLTVTLSTFAQVNRSLGQARDSDRLSQAARSLLDDQRDRRLQPGARSGVMDGDIAWSERVSAVAATQGQLRLLRVQLQLRIPGAAPWMLETLVVQAPTSSASAP